MTVDRLTLVLVYAWAMRVDGDALQSPWLILHEWRCRDAAERAKT